MKAARWTHPGLELHGAYAYLDWNRLIDTPVEVRKDFKLVRAGVVDDTISDSSALWLAARGVHGRALFAASEGYEILIHPREQKPVPGLRKRRWR